MTASSPFCSTFRGGGRSVELRIHGPEVTLRDGALPPARVMYPSVAVAMVAFEANARALAATGLVETSWCDGALPGVLAELGCDDDRTWIRVEDGVLRAVHVYEADPVSVHDGLAHEIAEAKRLGAFDPATADPGVLAIHALRRLAAHPATADVTRFGLELAGQFVDPVLDAVARTGLGPWVTHASLGETWNGHEGRPHGAPHLLGRELEGLRALAMPAHALAAWSAAPFPHLERVRLLGPPAWVAAGKAVPAEPALRALLDTLAAQAPALTWLALPAERWDEADVRTLLAHPLAPRLRGLALDEGPLTDAGARALVEAMPRLAGLAAVHAVAPPLAPAMHRASAAVRATRPEELRTVLAAAWEA